MPENRSSAEVFHAVHSNKPIRLLIVVWPMSDLNNKLKSLPQPFVIESWEIDFVNRYFAASILVVDNDTPDDN